jgi:hypothetical protein
MEGVLDAGDSNWDINFSVSHFSFLVIPVIKLMCFYAKRNMLLFWATDYHKL